MNEQRCVVCGKKVQARQRAYRISTGSMKPRGFGEKAVWGFAHHACFAQAVDSPKAVISELKRVADEPGVGTSTG